ncbi:hypothetical protein VC83_01145 [Pseudogymnoascus destructans]|uniref:Deacetylase sirtuin-type domain-containing protein n=2 Tax=Pseudogymnoascus destructans TaxID=655981 RepID=L8G973_PSED2|nr:uncharacterized protein VC83_01145 [Pseudogymnoascus destructans]ELR09790.1 hypothetical protein GMDG_04274 [Pseudogymnoascus destructans 20631-21]OAF62691.1 hypothetical protein VC83_01145 [Pseudogymnoascus destructans]
MDDMPGMSPPPSPLESLVSSPLSMRSRSPTPPYEYPSPRSSQPSGSRSSSTAPDMQDEAEGPPPAKKRKLAQPKERTTEYLDLHILDESTDPEKLANDDMQLQRLLKVLRTKRKIVVIAGAGISVSAGIPDFRSSTGLFTTLRSKYDLKSSGKDLFDAAVYKSDSSTASFHDMVREMSHITRQANPTMFHHMIATIAEEGRLMRLYTQNVDGIDTSLQPLRTNIPLNSRGPWPKTIQLHGGLEKMVCTKCRALSDFDGSLFEGSEPPSCKACEELDEIRTTLAGKRSHGIGRLRPRIVLYNEYNPDEEAIGAVTTADLKSRPDAVIVVGTSLKVPGVKRIAREMCQVARGRKDGFTAWINHGPEPVGLEFKDCWDLVIRGDCDEVARHAAIPKWDDKDVGPYTVLPPRETPKSPMKVELGSAAIHKAVEKTQGMVTPTASPRTRSPAPSKDLKKMKQRKLFSSGTATKPITKPAAAAANKKKPVAKKPAAAAKNAKITKAFTATKSSKATSGKAIKHEPIAPMFPNLSKAAPSSPMLPLSLVEVRNNAETTPVKREYGVGGGGKAEPAEPDSPSAQLRREGGRGTVSPGGVPRGMGHLIET